MPNFLVVGASSGIALALSKQLVSDGQQVYGTFNETSSLAPGLAGTLKLNVLNDIIDMGFLPESLDGIAYCPGAIMLKPFARLKPEDFIQDYQLQLIGAVRVIQACLPKLKILQHHRSFCFLRWQCRRASVFTLLSLLQKAQWKV